MCSGLSLLYRKYSILVELLDLNSSLVNIIILCVHIVVIVGLFFVTGKSLQDICKFKSYSTSLWEGPSLQTRAVLLALTIPMRELYNLAGSN